MTAAFGRLIERRNVFGSSRKLIMPKKAPESFNYLSNNPEFVPDPEIEELMDDEIAHAPKDPELLAHRLRNTASSPRASGGALDSQWEDVDTTGSRNLIVGRVP